MFSKDRYAAWVVALALATACGDDGAVAVGSTGEQASTSSPSTSVTLGSTATGEDGSTGGESTGGSTDGGDSDDTQPPVGACGNGVVDGDEQCDGTDLGGHDCVSQGADDGVLGCKPDCSLDVSGCIIFGCGNGIKEGRETCDGTDFGADDCVSMGFEYGTLACTANCMEVDVEGCSVCGNGDLEGNETCDNEDWIAGGTCSEDCQLVGDTCGDAVLIDPMALPFTSAGDTLMYANNYGYSTGVCPGETSGWNSGAEDVVYALTPDTSGIYTIVFSTTWDSTVYVVTDCDDVDDSCVGAADNGNPETVVTWLDAGSTYYIIGGHWSNSTLGGGGPYTLTVSEPCVPAGCDGISCGQDDGCGTICGCNGDEVCFGGTCVLDPPGDTCAAPVVVGADELPYSHSGDTLIFHNDYGYSATDCAGETSAGNGGAEDVVYAFTPDTDGVYTIAFDTTWNSTVYVVTDCGAIASSCVAGADNGNPETIVTALSAGTTYYVIGGHDSTTTAGLGGAYTLNISEPCIPTVCDGISCGSDGCGGTCECDGAEACFGGTCTLDPPGDTCEDPIIVGSLPYSHTANTLDYTNNYGYSTGVCPGETGGWNAGAEDVVYAFTPTTDGSYTISFGGTWDSTVYMVTDCADVDGTCVAGQDNQFSNDPPEQFTVDLDAGTTYYIIGGHWSNVTPGDGGPYQIDIVEN